MMLEKRQKIIVAIIIGVIVVGFSLWNYYGQRRETYIVSTAVTERKESLEEQSIQQEIKKISTLIVVHVEGEVQFPGIYSLQEGDRVFDAVEAAGGFTKEADRRQINLSKKVYDEEFIFIPSKGDFEGIAASVQLPPSMDHNRDGKININKASKEELNTLPGIGEVLASRIIEYREQKGSFKHIEDIKQVSGIGEKKFLDIQDKIKVQ